MPQAILQVTPEFFTEMLKSFGEGATRRFDVVENGLPSDARVLDVWSDGHSKAATITILIESASFPETPGGRDVPVLDPPVFRVYHDEPVT